MIVKVSLRLVEAIKLHRTDTTLDLSQKAEKGMKMNCKGFDWLAMRSPCRESQVWVAAFGCLIPPLPA